jgi:hypothetical protein
MKLTTKEVIKKYKIARNTIFAKLTAGILKGELRSTKSKNGGLTWWIEEQSIIDFLSSNNIKVSPLKRIKPKRIVYTPEEYNRILRAELGIPYKPLTYRHQEL